MTGTTDIAVRPGRRPSQAQPSAALELHSGQTMWTKDQHAALVAMGIPREASSAELGVFLHQCQRTGLDPFSRQIYLIYRKTYENGREINKPTMQVGIDGYRLIRDRIAKRDSLRVEYEPTVWYDHDGQAHEAWLWDEPPAGCRVAITVDGRRYSSVLRFSEYAQKKKDGTLNKMWSEKPAHMIEKCCEADVLRRAFPHDLSGIALEDEVPAPDPDAAPAPQRVTAERIRQERQPVTVPATVEPEDVPPAETAPGSPPSGQRSADGTSAGGGERPPSLASSGQADMIRQRAEKFGYSASPDDQAAWLRIVARLARVAEIASEKRLTQDQARQVLRQLDSCKDAQELLDLTNDGVMPDGEVPGGE